MPTKKSETVDWEFLFTGIDRGKTNVEYGADRRIFDQGQPADSIFYVRKGKAKLSVVSKQDKEAIIATLSAGDFLNLTASIPKTGSTNSAGSYVISLKV